jgi:ADP-heptose:LPS heptosyltransferase
MRRLDPILDLRYNGYKKNMTALIVRRAGGLGDVICMLPAVKSFTSNPDFIVTVAVPKEYWFLFHGCGVKFSEDYDFSFNRLKDYEIGFNCFCPCGLHEDKMGHRPILNRIENFAELMSVSPSKPIIKLAPTDRDLSGYGKNFIMIQVKTEMATKHWNIGKVQELVDRVVKELGYSVICIDKEIEMKNCFNTKGLSLLEIGHLLKRSKAVISWDSGIMHYALAMDIPTVCLFGPTNGRLTLKYYHGWSLIQKLQKDDCFRPCYYNTENNKFRCSERTGDCIDEITTDDVITNLKQILDGKWKI